VQELAGISQAGKLGAVVHAETVLMKLAHRNDTLLAVQTLEHVFTGLILTGLDPVHDVDGIMIHDRINQSLLLLAAGPAIIPYEFSLICRTDVQPATVGDDLTGLFVVQVARDDVADFNILMGNDSH